MAQWNLSVQLRGQGTDLTRTLRQASREARNLSRDVAVARREVTQLRTSARAPIRLRVAADTRGLRTQLRDAARDAAQGVQIRLPATVNTRGLRTEIRTAARDAARDIQIRVPITLNSRGLRTQLRTELREVARGQAVPIGFTLGNPQQLRRDLRAAVRLAGRDLRVTIHADLDAGAALAQIAALRLALEGLNTTADTGGGVASSASQNWYTLAAAVAAAFGAAATLAPVAATAVTTSLPIAFAALGAAALKSDAEVTQAFANLRSTATTSIKAAAAPIEPYLIDAMQQAEQAVLRLEDPLQRMFGAAGPMIDPMVDGLVDLGENALPGVERALLRSGPAMDGFESALGDIGTGVSDMFDEITRGNSDEFGQVWEILGAGAQDALVAVGEALGELTANESAVDSLEEAFELLVNSIELASRTAQNMAPVFEVVLTVFNALYDALNWAGDAFGSVWDTITGGGGGRDGEGKEELEGLSKAARELGEASGEAERSTTAFGSAADRTQAKLKSQKEATDQLRESLLALNDVNRSALDAQSGMEAAIDDAAQAARDNAGALSMVNGKLDLNGAKARDAYEGLSQLAAATGEAAAAAKDSGASWESVQGIYDRGRQKFIDTADAMGLTRGQAVALADQLLQPMHIQLSGAANASSDLEKVQKKLRGTKSKTVTVKALTKEGETALENLGFKIKRTKGKDVQITVPTGSPLSAVSLIQGALNNMSDTDVYVNVHRRQYNYEGVSKGTARSGLARGGLVRAYAAGGPVQGFPDGGPVSGPGTETSDDIPAWLSNNEYVIKAAAVHKYGAPFFDALNAMQLADGGQVTDWQYDPSTGSLYSPTDVGQAGHKTRKVKTKGGGTKEVEYFSLSALEDDLKKSAKITAQWNKNLTTVADRAGTDVAEALAAMGEDGIRLTAKMATGSKKYVDQMADALRGLAATAKASLTDYTRQLTAANKVNTQFQADLAKLAGMGYGDLAAQLAAQGDESAQQLASAAVKDHGKASSANTQAKKANAALTSEQVTQLVQIIAAVTSSKVGIHQVADKTGLGEDEIIDVASKSTAQIQKSLGSRGTRFLADLVKAGRGLAYAGGGLVRGPGTGTSDDIPAQLSNNEYVVRSAAVRKYGVGMFDQINAMRMTGGGAETRVIIVREQGPAIGSLTIPVTKSNATAADIGAQVGRQMRRARRGGVPARAGS